ncbi:MAG: FdtA/QdtA family cupin domain-containing protein [Deltaproteobacteria bacterium]|nr:FdtA/QdtA family cupin domain-containing protein [Deltaproteobacteria bacterium]
MPRSGDSERPIADGAGAAMPWGIASCRPVTFRSVSDAGVGLAFAEGGRDVPFAIARVYYLWNLHPGLVRARHAHRELQQVYLAVNGSIDVHLRDDQGERTVTLDQPQHGLYLGPMVWRHIEARTPGAVLLVLASDIYRESDYFRDLDAYLAAATEHRRQPGQP